MINILKIINEENSTSDKKIEKIKSSIFTFFDSKDKMIEEHHLKTDIQNIINGK